MPEPSLSLTKTKNDVKETELSSLICAMRCDEAMGRCNAFRIFRDEGRCNFGFITPASEDQEATNGPETEVYIKSIFSSFSRVLITSSPRHGLSRHIRLT